MGYCMGAFVVSSGWHQGQIQPRGRQCGSQARNWVTLGHPQPGECLFPFDLEGQALRLSQGRSSGEPAAAIIIQVSVKEQGCLDLWNPLFTCLAKNCNCWNWTGQLFSPLLYCVSLRPEGGNKRLQYIYFYLFYSILFIPHLSSHFDHSRWLTTWKNTYIKFIICNILRSYWFILSEQDDIVKKEWPKIWIVLCSFLSW